MEVHSNGYGTEDRLTAATSLGEAYYLSIRQNYYDYLIEQNFLAKSHAPASDDSFGKNRPLVSKENPCH
jgi:hypothetical protein